MLRLCSESSRPYPGRSAPTCGLHDYGSRTEDQLERAVTEPPDPKVMQAAHHTAMYGVTGQKSA